jgi:hypothetical protein
MDVVSSFLPLRSYGDRSDDRMDTLKRWDNSKKIKEIEIRKGIKQRKEKCYFVRNP